MGTMVNVDHSSKQGAVKAGPAASIDMEPIAAKLQDALALLDFIARKEAVTVEAVPYIELKPPIVNIEAPPLTIPPPAITVAPATPNIHVTQAQVKIGWIVFALLVNAGAVIAHLVLR